MESKTVVLATLNPGKAQEFQNLARKWGVRLIGAYEIIASHAPPEVVEDSDTYLGNARLKAEGFARWLSECAKPEFANLPVLADDSGLEVDALDGAPGVYSARYAGEHASSAQNMSKLLNVLSCVDDRRAAFRCILYLHLPGGESRVKEGILKGVIASTQSGTGGFGYDSIFVPSGHHESLASIKDRSPEFATHRTRAFEELFGS